MNKGFALWVVLATLCQGFAGCGEANVPYHPVSPSAPPPPPAPPPLQLAVDLRGNYALTFEVGVACEQVPKELRSRSYEASITYHSAYGSTDVFLAELTGATFHEQRPIWIEVARQTSGYSVWLDLAPSDNVILEEPARGTYLMVAGWEGVASVEPTELSTISTNFTGYFNYCVASSEVGPLNQCAFDTMVRSPCKSENSRWTLTRR